MPQEYESWDSDAPDIPRPTRLYHLPPIGLGTPMVESLTGYIVRLAEAHCVSAGVLYWKEIRALAGKGNIFTFRVSNDEGYSTHSINGFGSPATDFVRALEILTGRRDLHYLTLLTWGQVLARVSLLRRARSWCDSCLHGWRDAGQVIYEPLLWTLRAVTVCPYHHRQLRQVCSHCEKQIGPLDPRSRSGHCSRCGRTLVPRGAGSEANGRTLSHDDLNWAVWVANALGELLAAAPQLRYRPERTQLAQTIRLCVDHISSGNASEFARLLHVGRGDVFKWQRGETLPRLSVLVNIAYRQGRSLLDLFCNPPASGASLDFVRPALVKPEIPVRRAKMRDTWRIDITNLSQALRAALKEDPPPSVAHTIRRLKCHEVTIRRYFPELCSKLARRYAEYRTRCALQRKAQAAEEVRRISRELQVLGIKLTRRNIRPLLSSSDYLNLEEGRTALTEVRRLRPSKLGNR